MATYRDIKPELNIAPQQLPKIANPAPLGLAGFGLTTVLLSCINAGLIPATGANAVVPLAFAFGGIAQLIAGILEYANGNTFGMVAFTSYGCFWWWYAFMVWTLGAGWIKAPAPAAVALALRLWGVFTLYMWVATFPVEQRRVDGVPSVVDHFFPALGWRLRHGRGENPWRLCWYFDWNCGALCIVC